MKLYNHATLEKMNKEELRLAVKALQASNKHLTQNLRKEKLKLKKFQEKADKFNKLKQLLKD